VLTGFTLAAVGVCMLIVRRKRRFRMADLHPAIG
jgi:hypothetical protein